MKNKLKLYLVSVDEYDYDEYDSFIVAAYDEAQAKELSNELPGNSANYKVEHIGNSNAVSPYVVLGSFNAG